MSRKDIYREAAAIRDISHKYNAAFIVNDYIDIAMAVNADGVHLGQEDMPLEDARRIMGRRKNNRGVNAQSKAGCRGPERGS